MSKMVEFDMSKIENIFAAQTHNNLRLAEDNARYYLDSWLKYVERETIDISLCPNYSEVISKAVLKRLQEIKQAQQWTIRYCHRMNKSQLRALLRLFNRQFQENGDPQCKTFLQERNAPQYKSFLQMRRAAEHSYDCFMIRLFNMWIGIEKDGYTHS